MITITINTTLFLTDLVFNPNDDPSSSEAFSNPDLEYTSLRTYPRRRISSLPVPYSTYTILMPPCPGHNFAFGLSREHPAFFLAAFGLCMGGLVEHSRLRDRNETGGDHNWEVDVKCGGMDLSDLSCMTGMICTGRDRRHCDARIAQLFIEERLFDTYPSLSFL